MAWSPWYVGRRRWRVVLWVWKVGRVEEAQELRERARCLGGLEPCGFADWDALGGIADGSGVGDDVGWDCS